MTTARQLARYRELVDKKYLGGLSPEEHQEMESLGSVIDETIDAPPDVTATALRMLRRYGDYPGMNGISYAMQCCGDYAYGMHDRGDARNFWLAVRQRIMDLSQVREYWWSQL